MNDHKPNEETYLSPQDTIISKILSAHSAVHELIYYADTGQYLINGVYFGQIGVARLQALWFLIKHLCYDFDPKRAKQIEEATKINTLLLTKQVDERLKTDKNFKEISSCTMRKTEYPKQLRTKRIMQKVKEAFILIDDFLYDAGLTKLLKVQHRTKDLSLTA